jgi:penicillin G amidase
VPIRARGDGSRPVDGASGAYDWIGWATGSALPHLRDPPSGRLVNANNRIAPADFPVFLGRHWFADWRARRIRQLLDRHPVASLADFTAMQADVTSLFARALLPHLLTVPPPPGAAGVALRLLAGWNGAMVVDAPQPLIFQAWMDRFYRLVMAHNHVPIAAAVFAGPLTEFLPAVFAPGGARWCGGDCTQLLQTALTQATAALARRFGPDPHAWRWGAAHVAVFAHPLLAGIPLLRRVATLRIPSPGSANTIDAGGTPLGDFTSVHGPEFRAVYDLADLDASRFMMAPGQSGNLLSPLARNFLRPWRDGQTITIGPQPERVRATLRLVPARR